MFNVSNHVCLTFKCLVSLFKLILKTFKKVIYHLHYQTLEFNFRFLPVKRVLFQIYNVYEVQTPSRVKQTRAKHVLVCCLQNWTALITTRHGQSKHRFQIIHSTVIVKYSHVFSPFFHIFHAPKSLQTFSPSRRILKRYITGFFFYLIITSVLCDTCPVTMVTNIAIQVIVLINTTLTD